MYANVSGNWGIAAGWGAGPTLQLPPSAAAAPAPPAAAAGLGVLGPRKRKGRRAALGAYASRDQCEAAELFNCAIPCYQTYKDNKTAAQNCQTSCLDRVCGPAGTPLPPPAPAPAPKPTYTIPVVVTAAPQPTPTTATKAAYTPLPPKTTQPVRTTYTAPKYPTTTTTAKTSAINPAMIAAGIGAAGILAYALYRRRKGKS